MPDTYIDVEIYLPAVFRSKPLTCRGTIVWRKIEEANVVIGVRLLDLDDSQGEILKSVAVTLRSVTDDILGEDEDENDILSNPPPGAEMSTQQS